LRPENPGGERRDERDDPQSIRPLGALRARGAR
jgi:hypothetical protein